MNSSPSILAFTLLTLAPLLCNAESPKEHLIERPNIIFLLTDDQDTNSLGCYGNPEVKTPNIDKLASQGITFDKHYTTTAICMASRASIMTGMYEYKTGCNFEHGDMLTSTWNNTYPILLRESGYLTAFAGKFGFELKETPEGKSIGMPESDFDFWGGGEGQTHYETKKNPSMKKYAEKYPHSTLSYGAFGQDFIQQASIQEKPFCLSISFKAPHKPATPDPAFDDIYKGKTFTKPLNYGRDYSLHFSPQSKAGRQYERFYSWNYADNYNQEIATYYQQIYAIDVAVGMLINQLKESSLDKKTIIIFTSDNGFFNGAHGYGSKVLPYEEASRVPMIIFDPRNTSSESPQGQRSSSLTGNIDFAPTILELAGLTSPPNVDGKSLVPLLKNPSEKIHDSLALINVWGVHATQSLSVVTEDYKFIYWPYAGEEFTPMEELYNLQKDPFELTNLAYDKDSNYPNETMEKMRALYDQHLSHWAKNAVPYNHYQPYSTIFHRDTPWEKKQMLYKKQVNKANKKTKALKKAKLPH
ncbi:sulfatase [Akkermansiaceae bacterium]|nr:sulfatase [Akkermansiaceae bacterium]